MIKNDWNPEKYLNFDKERIQPNIDLVSRINQLNPASAVDIGCGPGNSTQILISRWPGIRTVGIDSSEAMIEKARTDYPGREWIVADAGKTDIDGTFDIAFSNSTIQWIPDHPVLIKWFHSVLNDGGSIAVQLPDFLEMPLGLAIDRVSKSSRWNSAMGDVSDTFTMHSLGEYYDMLSPLFTGIELWETRYVHIFPSQKHVFDMIYSTGLRPYLHRLESDGEKKEFENDIFNAIQADYPVQKDGSVLFTFYRMFFTGVKR